MDFHAFDSSQLDAYKAEAKERWGQTAAYAEFEVRYDASKDRVFAREMQAILKFWKMQSLEADHPDVQAQVPTCRPISRKISTPAPRKSYKI